MTRRNQKITRPPSSRDVFIYIKLRDRVMIFVHKKTVLFIVACIALMSGCVQIPVQIGQ